jgi:predicted HTH domain antitoxin
MTLQVKLPPKFNLNKAEIKVILAGELYERGTLSIGQAAEIAGLTKRAFIEIMGKYGYSLFSKSVDDVLSDIKNA